MRIRLFRWRGHDFVALSAEGSSGSARAQARDLLRRMASHLESQGLSLADAVRSRVWARERPDRDDASDERFATLSAAARAASSSYIAPDRFASDGSRVGIDLLAMRTPPGVRKVVVERDPPAGPVRYVAVGPFRFLAGVTCPSGSLAEQLGDILPRIDASLGHGGATWTDVARVTAVLHRDESVEELRRLLAPHVDPGGLVIGFADGYSLPGKRVEIEVTAVVG